MAGRHHKPKRGKSSFVRAAFPVVAALLAIPALAASNIHEATLDTQNREAITPARLLAPRAKAAIEEAFRTDSLIDLTKHDENRSESELKMETRLPGVSADDQSLYKKQMYRRDI